MELDGFNCFSHLSSRRIWRFVYRDFQKVSAIETIQLDWSRLFGLQFNFHALLLLSSMMFCFHQQLFVRLFFCFYVCYQDCAKCYKRTSVSFCRDCPEASDISITFSRFGSFDVIMSVSLPVSKTDFTKIMRRDFPLTKNRSIRWWSR